MRAACCYWFPAACLIIEGVIKMCDSVKFYTQLECQTGIYQISSFRWKMFKMNNKRYLEGDWTVQFWGHFPHCTPANQVPLLLVESCGNIFTLSFSQRSAPSARTATVQPLRSVPEVQLRTARLCSGFLAGSIFSSPAPGPRQFP